MPSGWALRERCWARRRPLCLCPASCTEPGSSSTSKGTSPGAGGPHPRPRLQTLGGGASTCDSGGREPRACASSALCMASGEAPQPGPACPLLCQPCGCEQAALARAPLPPAYSRCSKSSSLKGGRATPSDVWEAFQRAGSPAYVASGRGAAGASRGSKRRFTSSSSIPGPTLHQCSAGHHVNAMEALLRPGIRTHRLHCMLCVSRKQQKQLGCSPRKRRVKKNKKAMASAHAGELLTEETPEHTGVWLVCVAAAGPASAVLPAWKPGA